MEDEEKQWLYRTASLVNLFPRTYIKLRFDTFQETKGNKEALKAVHEFLDCFQKLRNGEEIERYPFLWLVGTPGLGKTHLCHAIAWQLIDQGINVKYYQAEELFDELRSGFNNHSYDKKSNLLKKIPLLIIDDIGAQSETNWSLAKLDMVIDYRYRAEGALVIASNTLDLPERIVDRLKEGWIKRLEGESWRGKNVKKGKFGGEAGE